MLHKETLDELAKKIHELIPDSLQSIQQDLQEKIKEVLQITFNKLDLITREEFDVQTKVLARTRDKVEHLEKILQDVVNSKPKDL